MRPGLCRPTTFLNVRQASSSQMVSEGRYRPPVKLGTVDLIAVPGAH